MLQHPTYTDSFTAEATTLAPEPDPSPLNTDDPAFPRFSVVIPLYNEAENVAPLVEEFGGLADRFDPFELWLVDDGSSDQTWQRIQAYAGHHKWLCGLRLRRNRGQSIAMLTGLAQARAKQLVTMDGDLQNDPADIPELLQVLENGVDVACGLRMHRQDHWSRRWASRVANRIRNWVTKDGIQDTGCSLKAFQHYCRTDLPPLEGVHRFMPAYFALNGRHIREVPVSHRARQFGESKYTNLRRLPRTAGDLRGFLWYRKRYRPLPGLEDLEYT